MAFRSEEKNSFHKALQLLLFVVWELLPAEPELELVPGELEVVLGVEHVVSGGGVDAGRVQGGGVGAQAQQVRMQEVQGRHARHAARPQQGHALPRHVLHHLQNKGAYQCHGRACIM